PGGVREIINELSQKLDERNYRMSWRRFDDGAMIVSSSGIEHEGWSLVEQNTAMRLTVADGAETVVRV
uniref:hypothetical protein n=1 Tax=Brevibacterium sp. FME17 TaxID=2742606 RepID=UPI0018691CC1